MAVRQAPRRSAWFTVHRWLGIGLGMWFALVGLTGSLLVYDEAIDALAQPAAAARPQRRRPAGGDDRRARRRTRLRRGRAHPLSARGRRGLPPAAARHDSAGRRRAHRGAVRSRQWPAARHARRRCPRRVAAAADAHALRIPPQRAARPHGFEHRRRRRPATARLERDRHRARLAAQACRVAAAGVDQPPRQRHAPGVRPAPFRRRALRRAAAAGDADRRDARLPELRA